MPITCRPSAAAISYFSRGKSRATATAPFGLAKWGRDLTEAEAAAAARTCALQLLAALKAEVGDLSNVKRIVRVAGFVNCADDFTAQSKVVNGASDFLVAVFGENGRHARTAIGVNALPFGRAGRDRADRGDRIDGS